MLGVGMAAGDGEVPVDEPEPPAQALLHPLEDRVGPAAKRALEVAVFDERHPRAGVSLHVVLIGDRWSLPLAAHDPPRAGAASGCAKRSSASMIPSAPGFTSAGER